jgi:hypothetical protein
MTELAEAVAPCADQTEAVEALLRRSFTALAPKALPFIKRTGDAHLTPIDVALGLEELFGLTADSGHTLTIRRDRAGPSLGYPNGNEGLRKAWRMIKNTKLRLTDLLQLFVAAQLQVTAATSNINYSRKYSPHILGTLKPDDLLPYYLDLLASLNIDAANEPVRDLAAFIEQRVSPATHGPSVSPIGSAISAEFPELSKPVIEKLSVMSAYFFIQLLDIYETSTYRIGSDIDKLAYFPHPTGGLLDWYSCIPYFPEEGAVFDQGDWLLLWLIHRWEGSSEQRWGIAKLLGIHPSYRGEPRTLRQNYASGDLGYDSGSELVRSTLPLDILYYLSYALTRIVIEWQSYHTLRRVPHPLQLHFRPEPSERPNVTIIEIVCPCDQC